MFLRTSGWIRGGSGRDAIVSIVAPRDCPVFLGSFEPIGPLLLPLKSRNRFCSSRIVHGSENI